MRPTRHTRYTRHALAALAAAGLLAGCMLFVRPPKDLDYSRTRASEAGRYRVTIRPQGDSSPQGRLQRWTLHVETTAGVPVDSGAFAVDGGMPQHGHGLPTKPRATRRNAQGDVVIDGMKFNMGGWWVVKFAVTCAGGAPDSLTFNIKL